MGVWQRRWIQFEGSEKESTQRVWWIQAESTFADVRSAPFGGPLTAEQYQTMTWRQRFDVDLLGFAGHFTWSASSGTQGICTWHHAIAITPRSRPDSSTFQWISPHDFLEQGICEDEQGHHRGFLEHWHRIYDGTVTVYHLRQSPYQGQALVGDSWAVMVYKQPETPLPCGKPHSIGENFSASAWQKGSGNWQLEFGSHTFSGNHPIWTPKDWIASASQGTWQRQTA